MGVNQEQFTINIKMSEFIIKYSRFLPDPAIRESFANPS